MQFSSTVALILTIHHFDVKEAHHLWCRKHTIYDVKEAHLMVCGIDVYHDLKVSLSLHVLRHLTFKANTLWHHMTQDGL